ncbi:hypothetical protein IFM89_035516 [Coptis chinensis]|uniref:F-box domain-containing protein n=1 Tax=Coptis chinensis TaxID=261450 RepID=A0A835H7Y8_9MAGN|nr:hypothetical protein IFM89_035516 [Coptis chinensis]
MKDSKKRRYHVDQLPYDLQLNILSRVDVKFLLRLKSVCKQWRLLVKDPIFVKEQLHRSKNNAHLVILGGHECSKYHLCLYSINKGSWNYIHTTNIPLDVFRTECCNGLICYCNWYADLHVCNPSTRESVLLPKNSGYWEALGFGFDPSANKYKVICISLFRNEVLTLGNRSWRTVTSRPAKQIYGPSICINGTLHWDDDDMLVTFDLSTEDFGVIPYPKSTFKSIYSDFAVGEIEGCLGIVASDAVDNRCFDVWILKDHNNRVWEKERVVLAKDTRYMTVFPIVSRSGDILIQDLYCSMYSYNRKSRRTKTIRCLGLSLEAFSMEKHVESLVSLSEMYMDEFSAVRKDGVVLDACKKEMSTALETTKGQCALELEERDSEPIDSEWCDVDRVAETNAVNGSAVETNVQVHEKEDAEGLVIAQERDMTESVKEELLPIVGLAASQSSTISSEHSEKHIMLQSTNESASVSKTTNRGFAEAELFTNNLNSTHTVGSEEKAVRTNESTTILLQEQKKSCAKALSDVKMSQRRSKRSIRPPNRLNL